MYFGKFSTKSGFGFSPGQIAPVVEQHAAVAFARQPLQELLRHHLVGVHIDAVERQRRVRHVLNRAASLFTPPRPHSISRTSTKCPASAAAAAITGLTRCVRPPLPWRPSKLRFDVLAQRSPARQHVVGFMPMHMLHPASRHSKPASRKIWSSPSASASRFHHARAGNHERALEAARDVFPGDQSRGRAQIVQSANSCTSR